MRARARVPGEPVVSWLWRVRAGSLCAAAAARARAWGDGADEPRVACDSSTVTTVAAGIGSESLTRALGRRFSAGRGRRGSELAVTPPAQACSAGPAGDGRRRRHQVRPEQIDRRLRPIGRAPHPREPSDELGPGRRGARSRARWRTLSRVSRAYAAVAAAAARGLRRRRTLTRTRWGGG
eukprot:366331-Chlamydomonas_euryale.AAC.5